MRKTYLLTPLIILIVFVLALVFFASKNGHNHLIRNRDFHTLNEDWQTVTNGETVSLPYITNDVPENQKLKLSKVLPSAFEFDQVILIRTSLQDISVFLDGVLIYEHQHEKIGRMNAFASLWHMVDIPDSSDTKVLEIEVTSPYKSMNGRLNTIYFGNEADLNTHLITTYGFRLLIGILVVLISLVLIILNMVFVKNVFEDSTLLAAFGIFLGSWIIAESRLMQFFVGQSLIIGSLAYISLSLMPIPLVLFIKKTLDKRYKNTFNFMTVVFMINFIAIYMMHVTGVLDFFESVIFTQILVGIGLFWVIGIFIYDFKKYKNNSIKKVFIALLFFIVIGLLEFINFLKGNFELTSVFVVTGIGLMMIVALGYFIKELLNKFKTNFEKEMYQKLAYLDVLTGSANRLAYERDIEVHFGKKEKDNLVLIYFDFDELKQINDNFGHLEGDRVLIEGSSILNAFFKPFGTIYRVGGDEFVFLGFIEKSLLDDKLKNYKAYMAFENKKQKRPISISYGIAYYDKTMLIPKDLMMKADYAMYDLKKAKKETK